MTTRRYPRPTRNGFSIIELLIAVLLGVLVVAGLIQVLVSDRQAYRLQQSGEVTQQSMRQAMDMLTWSLHMADFWGGIKPDTITGYPTVTGAAGACNAAWVDTASQPIYGYDGAAAFPLSGCTPASSYVPGTDVLVTRYANPDAVAPASSTASGAIYVQVRAGTQGVLFAGDGTHDRPAQLPFVDSTGNAIDGTYTYPYNVAVYYLSPCSDPGATGCSAASDSGAPVPTLMRMSLDATGSLVSVPLVSGIEQLQFEYGVRNPATPDQHTPVLYEDAAAVTAANAWPYVVSVRIAYVMRGSTRNVEVPQAFDSNSGASPTAAAFSRRLSADCYYTVSAAGVITTTKCPSFSAASVGTAGSAQQFRRDEITAVVQVRNLTR